MVNNFIKKIYNKFYNYYKQNNICCINITIILIIIIIVSYIILNNNNKNNNNKSYFDDINGLDANGIPMTTRSQEEVIFGKNGPPQNKEIKACSVDNDVVGICSDYDNCCNSNAKSNCFCTNSIVLSCKNQYDTCMADTNTPAQVLMDTCGEKNKACCAGYNNKSVDTNTKDNKYFNNPETKSKNDNILCSIMSVKDIESKCLELCQNEPKCMAISVSASNCNLHTDKTPNLPKKDTFGNDIIDNKIKFYTKK